MYQGLVLRVPSVLFVGLSTFLFLLYFLPWHDVPINLPRPSPVPSVPPSSCSSSSSPGSPSPPDETMRKSRSYVGGPLPLGRNDKQHDHDRHFPVPTPPLRLTTPTGLVPYRAIIQSGLRFNASGADVLVLLHIQKTGGTSFEKHIVQDLSMEQPCICWKRRKRCKCPRPNRTGTGKQSTEPWLFSRFSTGWVCGLHADWTELTACVDTELDKAHGSPIKRRYFYVTVVRDPIHRFMSEFRHVQRGATWRASRHICDSRYATAEELGSCYSGRSWTGVSLSEFLKCPHNLAFNRQTRMLADLSLVGCYNRSYMPPEERDRVILASAKHNLETMAFVGLTEKQRMSQYIFEETFGLRFKSPFTQNEDTFSTASISLATAQELEEVRRVNSLDLEIYGFAEQLLNNRFQELKQYDPNFEDHYNYLGEEKGRHFSWDEVEAEE